MAGSLHGHFIERTLRRYLGGAVPGGGGGSDAVPPLSSGVMRRTVTRRLIRLGPSVWSFRYCFAYSCEVRFAGGTPNCCVSNSAADWARRSDSDRLSTSDPTASVWPSIRNTSRGLRAIARLRPSAITCSFAAWSGGISHDPVSKLMLLRSMLGINARTDGL